MINGMTGFGTAQFSDGQSKGIVEIKSVNHRYFDLSFYLPIGFGSLENKIRSIVSKKLSRGKVVVSVKITQKAPATISFNKETIRKYIKYSKSLQKEWRLANNLTLADLVRLPGVVEARETLVKADTVWPLLEKSLKKSLNELLYMRKKEGQSLFVDVNDKLKRMHKQVVKIKKRAKDLLSKNKKKLTEDEFLSYQKGCDINEELERLAHYIDEIKAVFKSGGPAGKKMDFIAQEMQRETNTMGSKLQDKVVSNAVISLKSKVEKIREQAQNIE